MFEVVVLDAQVADAGATVQELAGHKDAGKADELAFVLQVRLGEEEELHVERRNLGNVVAELQFASCVENELGVAKTKVLLLGRGNVVRVIYVKLDFRWVLQKTHLFDEFN